MTTLQQELNTFSKGGFRGFILLPGDPEYEKSVSSFWNAMHRERRPVVIFKVAGASDVSKAILFAKAHQLEIAVRSGGHGGQSSNEGGVMIDLSLLKHVIVDPVKRTANCDAGCLLSDVDNETENYGLAVPLGTAPVTGIGGLALHGGFGLLSRKHGLSMDNILEVEIVTADGKIWVANEHQNSDLFWGCKGGASNFGVVTRILFRLHPLPNKIYGGIIIQPALKIRETLVWTRDLLAKFEEIGLAVQLLPSPKGRLIATHIAHYGPVEEAKEEVQKLIALAPVLQNTITEQTYGRVQASLGPFVQSNSPMRQHEMFLVFPKLTDEIIDLFTKEWEELMKEPHNNFGTVAGIVGAGSAISKYKEGETPMSIRDKDCTIMALPFRWVDPAHDQMMIETAKEFASKFDRYRLKQSYINAAHDVVVEAHGKALSHLQELKQQWDPENVFKGTLSW